MSVQVKICGLNDATSVRTVAAGGAAYAGFVFYPKSPRAVDPETAGSLIALLPPAIVPVGLFVDPGDEDIARALASAPLQALQLHGSETPQRVREIKSRTGLTIIKAVGVAAPQDIEGARRYEAVADLLLLDAKPEPDAALPGGNARVFDWDILKGMALSKPWLLAGGLTAANMEQAVARTGARIVDVSSGVEDAPGHKNSLKIKEFLRVAAGIETSY